MTPRKRAPSSGESRTDKKPRTRSSPATQQLPPGPACPGEVKTRDRGALSKLPPGSDIFEAFTKVRAAKHLTYEEAFLELLTTFDIPLSTLSQTTKTLDISFSNASYQQITPYVWLDPNGGGRDMSPLDVCRSRIPTDLFRDITGDVEDALTQYGPIDAHENEEAKSRFISSLFSRIVCLFNSIVVNKPGTLLESEFTRRGRIEHHFISLDTVGIVFVEVEKILTVGKSRLDLKAQVLAECAACDYANLKQGHWVPVLAILCDGNNFEFLVYDSADKAIYSSGRMTGIVADERGDHVDLLISTKKTCEYLFDWFVMGYINSLQSFGHVSLKGSRVTKRESTGQWESALAAANTAHWYLRGAAEAAKKAKLRDAEAMASHGVEQLKLSVSLIPCQPPYEKNIEIVWDGIKPLEEAFSSTIQYY